MRSIPIIGIRGLFVAAVVLASSATAARAHVSLDRPNGGEVLEVGSVFTITWHIAIAHNLQNWDLWYSTTGSTGLWTTLVMNLPVGSGQVGTVHSYDWTIPSVVDGSVGILSMIPKPTLSAARFDPLGALGTALVFKRTVIRPVCNP